MFKLPLPDPAGSRGAKYYGNHWVTRSFLKNTEYNNTARSLVEIAELAEIRQVALSVNSLPSYE